MNILAVIRERDYIRPFRLPDGINCLHVENCEEALRAVNSDPRRFDIVVVGSSVTDAADVRDREMLLSICRKNPDLLIAICSGANYVSIDFCSIPSIFALSSPVDAEAVMKMICRAERIKRKRRNASYSRIQVSAGRKIKLLFLEDVYYVKKARNGLAVITAEDEYRHAGSMDNFAEKAGTGFLRCHNSFTVNMGHVSGMEGSDIVLYSGEKLPVSRSYRKFVREYFKKYTFLHS
ncbi:MAG: LytR/AlgR family response regulator transcription factor [Anaerovoracaceae bacterium]